MHRYSTPEILYQLDNYDVIVARGITYGKICKLYPEKHITRLVFDGMDIVEALFQCRNTYHPSHIGLCLGRDRLQDLLPELEDLSGAQVSLYDVQDEESAKEAVDACLRDGADAVVNVVLDIGNFVAVADDLALQSNRAGLALAVTAVL